MTKYLFIFVILCFSSLSHGLTLPFSYTQNDFNPEDVFGDQYNFRQIVPEDRARGEARASFVNGIDGMIIESDSTITLGVISDNFDLRTHWNTEFWLFGYNLSTDESLLFAQGWDDFGPDFLNSSQSNVSINVPHGQWLFLVAAQYEPANNDPLDWSFAGAANITAIPEPATIVMFALCSLTTLLYRNV